MLARKRLGVLVGLVLIVTLGLLIVPSMQGQDELQGKFGGTLRVAPEEELAIWDIHRTTSVLVRKVAHHIWERLFVQAADYSIIPDLAESYTVSDDSLVYTIKLREGVLFHNNKEMTSEDVVASITRWGSYGPLGSQVYAFVDSVEAIDKYTMRINLKETCGFLLPGLATNRQGAFIYPKEIVEELERTGEMLDPTPDQIIGTGPYKFVEFIPDRYTKLVRFDEYKPRTDEPNGYGGRRTAYFDEILFIPILDATVRSAAVETGEIDFAMGVSLLDSDRLEINPDVIPLLGPPWYPAIIFNMTNGKGRLSGNLKLRQAIQAALDMEEMAIAAIGSEMFYRVDPSIMWKETAWWTDAGSDRYNQANLEIAKQLLEESGYQGEKIRWFSAMGYPVLYDTGVIAVSQLRKLGLNIEHRAVEWGEISRIRKDPDLWDVIVIMTSFRTDPALNTYMPRGWVNHWDDDPYKDNLMHKMVAAPTLEERFAIWEQLQDYFYDQVPWIKAFDYFTLNAMQKYVKGYTTLEGKPRMPEEFFWNVWFEGK